MAAAGAMNMAGLVSAGVVIGRTPFRVLVRDRDHMLVDMIFMRIPGSHPLIGERHDAVLAPPRPEDF
jgi:hypothetical protein